VAIPGFHLYDLHSEEERRRQACLREREREREAQPGAVYMYNTTNDYN